MSDMLTRETNGVLLLTGVCNIQALRSSVIAGVSAIVFVSGKNPMSISFSRQRITPYRC